MSKITNLQTLIKTFANEDICRKYLAEKRWHGKPVCPYCGHDKVYVIENGKRYKCANKECRTKFSVTIGTIFEDSNIPLSKWFIALYLCNAHKKGIASLQLSRDITVTQKTAWFMLHRIREAMSEKNSLQLCGIVEADETYVGGKEKNKHKDKKTKGTQGRSTQTKTVVFGLLERGGNVEAQKVPDAKGKTLKPIINEKVKEGTTISTDECRGYRGLEKKFEHIQVNHSKGIYVDGIAYTNTLEGYWSLFKRGVYGIYHNISDKHTDRYLDEFSQRYNTRKISDVERFDLSLSQVEGRLTYKQLIAKC